MRRKDRQVTDMERIKECLDKSEVLHVAFADSEVPYVVPVNFGYDFEGDRLVLYYHGASEGRKAELALKSPGAGFCMETSAETVSADTACGFTEHFLSVIGNGTVSVLTDSADKRKGLNCIMLKASGKEWDYPEEVLNITNVFRIDVTDYTCKENI